ncbi:hypothetical protein L1887_59341 [Cichorium endivia]|nr:hypothetical protein L1887_59341 [Cichorium endivia]
MSDMAEVCQGLGYISYADLGELRIGSDPCWKKQRTGDGRVWTLLTKASWGCLGQEQRVHYIGAVGPWRHGGKSSTLYSQRPADAVAQLCISLNGIRQGSMTDRLEAARLGRRSRAAEGQEEDLLA